VPGSAGADFVLDTFEEALHDQEPLWQANLVHHSDREVRYVSVRYTKRPAEAGIEPSVGSVRDAYDNILAETVIGLFKAVEFATP
jgi:putative transposase